jgi:hypothetical protein
VVTASGIPSQISANRKEEADADGISSQSTDSNQGKPVSGSNAKVVARQAGSQRKPASALSVSKSSAAAAALAKAENGKIGSERRTRWMELLESRPSTKQGDSMSTWLMEVLAVSDLETPLMPGVEAKAGAAPLAPGDEAKTAIAAATAAAAAASKPASRSKKKVERGDAGDTTSTDDESTRGMEDRANGGTKKRPAEDLAGDDDGGKDADSASDGGTGEGDSDFFVTGSFAAWKERKKAKNQAKLDAQPHAAKEESA